MLHAKDGTGKPGQRNEDNDSVLITSWPAHRPSRLGRSAKSSLSCDQRKRGKDRARARRGRSLASRSLCTVSHVFLTRIFVWCHCSNQVLSIVTHLIQRRQISCKVQAAKRIPFPHSSTWQLLGRVDKNRLPLVGILDDAFCSIRSSFPRCPGLGSASGVSHLGLTLTWAFMEKRANSSSLALFYLSCFNNWAYITYSLRLEAGVMNFEHLTLQAAQWLRGSPATVYYPLYLPMRCFRSLPRVSLMGLPDS